MKLLLAFALSACSLTAAAADDVRNGQPCLGGVCIGDDLASLAHVQWDEAQSFRKKVSAVPVPPAALARLAKNVAPASQDALKDAAPYLMTSTFDGPAIPRLAKVKSFCRPVDHLVGTFRSESGYPTRVFVAIDPRGGEQAFRVRSIVRTYPDSLTSAQLGELEQQLAARYAGVRKASADTKASTWNFNPHKRELQLQSAVVPPSRLADELKRTPGCGAAAKLD